jgi:hypothetical protein
MKVLWRISIQGKTEGIYCDFSDKFGDDLDTEEKMHHRFKEL